MSLEKGSVHQVLKKLLVPLNLAALSIVMASRSCQLYLCNSLFHVQMLLTVIRVLLSMAQLHGTAYLLNCTLGIYVYKCYQETSNTFLFNCLG